MAHPFSIKDEVTVEASPDDVWEALTVGPKMDSWFMGRSEFEPRAGGTARTDVGGFVMQSTITAWEPGKRLAYQTPEGPDGSLMAFEYLIEGRDGGQTTIRFVHSGFLGGESWEAEYVALKKGDPAYLYKLAQYLTHFRNQVSTSNLFVPMPQSSPKAEVWARFRSQLGLGDTAHLGDRVDTTLDGLPRIVGEVDYLNDDFLGVLGDDGLYRFIHGHDGSVVVEHHIFSDAPARRATPEAWANWLRAVLAA